MYNTFLAALCIILLSLTGIIGTLNILLCKKGRYKDIIVTPKGENDIEYKVRQALMKTRGNVIIDTLQSDKSGDFEKICDILCRSNVRVAERTKNIE